MLDMALASTAPDFDLLAIKLHVAFLKLAHFLNFVKVNYKALLQVVQLPDALTAEDAGVLTAVEVLDALVVLLAQVRLNVLVLGQVLSLKALIEIDGCQ